MCIGVEYVEYNEPGNTYVIFFANHVIASSSHVPVYYRL